MNKIECDVKVELPDLRHYMYYHKYMRPTGFIELIAGLLCLVFGIYNYAKIDTDYQPFMIFLIFFGFYFLIFLPLNTFFTAFKQFTLNPTYKNTYHYLFDKKGMTISLEDDSATLEWKDFYRVLDNKRSIVVYISKYNANIIPKRELGEKVDALKALLRANLPARKVRGL